MKSAIFAALVAAVAIGHPLFAQSEDGSDFRGIVSAYLDLKNALTVDKADSAAIAAAGLSRAINGDHTFSGSLIEVWKRYQPELSRETIAIAKAKDIASQRERFKALSADMYNLLKAVNVYPRDLYYDYCPMAKAYWISEKASIVNPYEGLMMPTCGSVKDTLKAIQ